MILWHNTLEVIEIIEKTACFCFYFSFLVYNYKLIRPPGFINFSNMPNGYVLSSRFYYNKIQGNYYKTHILTWRIQFSLLLAYTVCLLPDCDVGLTRTNSSQLAYMLLLAQNLCVSNLRHSQEGDCKLMRYSFVSNNIEYSKAVNHIWFDKSISRLCSLRHCWRWR